MNDDDKKFVEQMEGGSPTILGYRHRLCRIIRELEAAFETCNRENKVFYEELVDLRKQVAKIKRVDSVIQVEIKEPV